MLYSTNIRLKTTLSAILLCQITYFVEEYSYFQAFLCQIKFQCYSSSASRAYAFTWTNLIPADRPVSTCTVQTVLVLSGHYYIIFGQL